MTEADAVRRGVEPWRRDVAARVVIEREADGRYSVYVPALPGCASWGATFQQAVDHIREAIELHIESLESDAQPVPVGDREVRVEDVEVTV